MRELAWMYFTLANLNPWHYVAWEIMGQWLLNRDADMQRYLGR